jgi:hypothetical protein
VRHCACSCITKSHTPNSFWKKKTRKEKEHMEDSGEKCVIQSVTLKNIKIWCYTISQDRLLVVVLSTPKQLRRRRSNRSNHEMGTSKQLRRMVRPNNSDASRLFRLQTNLILSMAFRKNNCTMQCLSLCDWGGPFCGESVHVQDELPSNSGFPTCTARKAKATLVWLRILAILHSPTNTSFHIEKNSIHCAYNEKTWFSCP